METTRYKLKCGLKPEELLIEFEDVSFKENFAESFSNLISSIDGSILDIEKKDSSEDVLYYFESEIGSFRVSSDNFGTMVILPDESEEVLYRLDLLFKSDKYFHSVEN